MIIQALLLVVAFGSLALGLLEGRGLYPLAAASCFSALAYITLDRERRKR